MPDPEEKSDNKTAGLVFVGCIMAGSGVGMAFGRPDIGGLIGVGLGFLLMVVVKKAKE
jgi:hypothetical protein